jgi:hypothetical protein
MILTADTDHYHVECAKRMYGEAAITQAIAMASRFDEFSVTHDDALFEQWPKDRQGNLIHVDAGCLTDQYQCARCNNLRIEQQSRRRGSGRGGEIVRNPILRW